MFPDTFLWDGREVAWGDLRGGDTSQGHQRGWAWGWSNSP